MNNRLRKQLAWLHTWTGLILSLILLMFVVTGMGLVFPQLNNVVNSDLLTVSACTDPAMLDTLVNRAKAIHPSSTLSNIDIRAETTASVAVQFANKDYVYLDPCTTDILGVQNEYGGFIGSLNNLHRFRFMEHGVGKSIGGWSTVAFMVMLIIGGIILWWPKPGVSIKSAATFNPRLPGIARTLNLHKVAGIYLSVVLLLIAITALPIAFKPVKQLLYSSAGYTPFIPPRSVPIAADHPVAALNGVMRTSAEHFPDWEWMSINVQKKAEDAIKVEIVGRDAPHENAKSYLYLDAFSGQVLAQLNYDQDTQLGRKLYLYCIALHAALVGGLSYQLLLFIATLGLGLLIYSGISVYLRRKLRKSEKVTLSLQLVDKKVEATGICSFELADPKGKQLPSFSAGSHLDVHLNNGIIRQYSLCNNPLDRHRYVIGVLHANPSRGGSSTLHDRIDIGDTIEVSLPKNHFPMVYSAGHSLLIAGGIGITPLLCMAEGLSTINADFHLHYCVSTPDRAAFMDYISRSAFAGRVSLHVSATEGRLDIAALLDGYAGDTHIYVCGPNSLTDTVIDVATSKGWLDSQIHREYFSAADHSGAINKAFDVKIASSGKLIHIPEHQSVTDALAGHGVDIPVSCAEGVCGTCLTRVLDGEIDHRDVFLTQNDRHSSDQFTPCCSRARSSVLVLDL